MAVLMLGEFFYFGRFSKILAERTVGQLYPGRNSHRCQDGRVGSDYTIVSSSHSFVVFDFSFDVLTQNCMSKLLDPL